MGMDQHGEVGYLRCKVFIASNIEELTAAFERFLLETDDHDVLANRRDENGGIEINSEGPGIDD